MNTTTYDYLQQKASTLLQNAAVADREGRVKDTEDLMHQLDEIRENFEPYEDGRIIYDDGVTRVYRMVCTLTGELPPMPVDDFIPSWEEVATKWRVNSHAWEERAAKAERELDALGKPMPATYETESSPPILRAQSDAWEETAKQNQRNTDYYHGLLKEIGDLFGEEARTADDGFVYDGVLASKVPKLVKELQKNWCDGAKSWGSIQKVMPYDNTGRPLEDRVIELITKPAAREIYRNLGPTELLELGDEFLGMQGEWITISARSAYLGERASYCPYPCRRKNA